MRLVTPSRWRFLPRRPQRHGTRGILYGMAAVLLALSSPAVSCTGDCNGDGMVTVDEILLGVSIALGHTSLETCRGFDADQNGAVTVEELVAAVNAALAGCPSPTPSATVTPSATESPTATATPTLVPMDPVFTDVTVAAGLDFLQYRVPDDPPFDEAVYFSGGAAAGDYDNDGWVDLYVTRLDAPGILFHNKGDGTFEDRTALSGLDTLSAASNGAAWADIDNDGDLDL